MDSISGQSNMLEIESSELKLLENQISLERFLTNDIVWVL